MNDPMNEIEAKQVRRNVRALNRAVKRTTTPPWRRVPNIVGALALTVVVLLGAAVAVTRGGGSDKAAGCYSYPARVYSRGFYSLTLGDYPYHYCTWTVGQGYGCAFRYDLYQILYSPPSYSCAGGGGGGGGGGGW